MKQTVIQFILVNRSNYQGITLQIEWVQNGLKYVNEYMFKSLWPDDNPIPLYPYIFIKVVAEQDMQSLSHIPLQSHVNKKESNS